MISKIGIATADPCIASQVATCTNLCVLATYMSCYHKAIQLHINFEHRCKVIEAGQCIS